MSQHPHSRHMVWAERVSRPYSSRRLFCILAMRIILSGETFSWFPIASARLSRL